MENQIAKRPNFQGQLSASGSPDVTIKDYLERNQSKIAEVAGKIIDPARFTKSALLAIHKNPELLRCTPQSILFSLLQAAELGLSVSTALGESYLVPYGVNATFIIGYRGFIELARRSGKTRSFMAYPVYSGDVFEPMLGDSPAVRHIPKFVPNAALTHAYAVAKLESGETLIDVMSRLEIDAVRAMSKMANKGPWLNNFAEMARKTVARRLAKYLPHTPEMESAIEANDTEFPNIRENVLPKRLEGPVHATEAAQDAAPLTEPDFDPDLPPNSITDDVADAATSDSPGKSQGCFEDSDPRDTIRRQLEKGPPDAVDRKIIETRNVKKERFFAMVKTMFPSAKSLSDLTAEQRMLLAIECVILMHAARSAA